jgi:hypothetical protein
MAINAHRFGDKLVECKHVHTNGTDLSTKQDLIPAVAGKSIVVCDLIVRAVAIDISFFDGDSTEFYKFITSASVGPDTDSAAGGFRAPIMLTEGNALRVQAGSDDTTNSITITYYYA